MLDANTLAQPFESRHTARRTPASPEFLQAADASMERCGLYLFRYLPPEVEEQLSCLLQRVRHELGLAPAHDPLLDCRDWPADAEASDALAQLLERLLSLERNENLARSLTRVSGHRSCHNPAS